MSDRVLTHLLGERAGFLDRLSDFVAYPSVSADTTYADGMDAAQQWLMRRLSALGFGNVDLLSAGGQSAVAAEWIGAPGAPTILVYGHYDVQPPDPMEKWDSPPFSLTERGSRLYARGVSDDKAPSLIAIETLGAFLAVEGQLPVNVKFLFEGEEEIGSASLRGILEKYRAELDADAMLSADGARWRPDLPTLATSCRGNAGFEFSVRTAAKDLHSGRYGGVVPNALHVMATLIASLYQPDGRIAVADFFDGVKDPTPEQRSILAEIPFDENATAQALEAVPVGEPGFTWLERNWLRPSLDVNGMWGGYTGLGSKTVIPNEAFTKITMRLVPGQDPDACVVAVYKHLQAHCPASATLTFGAKRGSSRAYSLLDNHPLLLAAEETLRSTTGRLPLRVGIGATLPVASIMAETLGIETVMFSYSTADEDYHAPNEFFRLSSIDEGFTGWDDLLRRLGQQSPDTYIPFRRKRSPINLGSSS